jgi:hypothetical protein
MNGAAAYMLWDSNEALMSESRERITGKLHAETAGSTALAVFDSQRSC